MSPEKMRERVEEITRAMADQAERLARSSYEDAARHEAHLLGLHLERAATMEKLEKKEAAL